MAWPADDPTRRQYNFDSSTNPWYEADRPEMRLVLGDLERELDDAAGFDDDRRARIVDHFRWLSDRSPATLAGPAARLVLKCADGDLPAVLDALCAAARQGYHGDEMREVAEGLWRRYEPRSTRTEPVFRDGILCLLLELLGYCGILNLDEPGGPVSKVEEDRQTGAAVLYMLVLRPLDFLKRAACSGGRDPLDVLLGRVVCALRRTGDDQRLALRKLSGRFGSERLQRAERSSS